MISIAFFNNKGGVGKTTLACNFAAYLAQEKNQRVVVADCDPQANASQLLLDEPLWESIYEERKVSEDRTVLRALSHIRAGDSSIDSSFELVDSSRFGVRVLAGHPSLSTVEDQLSTSWVEFRAGILGGARRSLWAHALRDAVDSDVLVFDLGPSLGALNRSVLLGCDYFVTPVAADLFSLYALENIGEWMTSWTKEYGESFSRIGEKNVGFDQSYDIPPTPRLAHGYVGYTVQQYIAKASGGRIRKTVAYDRYRVQIPDRAKALDELRAPLAESVELGVVPNMFSMVPLAQSAHAPIASLTSADGVRGAQVYQHGRYVSQLSAIFANLAANVGVA